MPEHAYNCSTTSVLQMSQVWVTHPLVDGLQRWRERPSRRLPTLSSRERCVYGLRTRESLFSNTKPTRPASHPPTRLASASSSGFGSEMRMNGTSIVFRSTLWRPAFAAPPHPYPQSHLRFTADANGGRVDAAIYTVIVCSDSELAIVSCTVVRGGGE
ncbi:hypothetical protein K438DRAFT_1987782 [Mycena galopus ATCC 62051]|nr:hypothetical protein K438DRAFT_1987782 [Mycena galopus ATCC 62051]